MNPIMPIWSLPFQYVGSRVFDCSVDRATSVLNPRGGELVTHCVTRVTSASTCKMVAISLDLKCLKQDGLPQEMCANKRRRTTCDNEKIQDCGKDTRLQRGWRHAMPYQSSRGRYDAEEPRVLLRDSHGDSLRQCKKKRRRRTRWGRYEAPWRARNMLHTSMGMPHCAHVSAVGEKCTSWTCKVVDDSTCRDQQYQLTVYSRLVVLVSSISVLCIAREGRRDAPVSSTMSREHAEQWQILKTDLAKTEGE
ncbi:hypothetical protein C8Q77DRAFT_536051 [Trametes polyzona]|nr:hypothetical protein C8Q77DRAFT_536051 [Trametes polyzona]